MKKNILITGATSGLGLDLYKNLKKDEKINLICFYKDKNKINKIKNKSNFIKVDFFNKNDVSNLSNLNILKNIDTVIHCAGGGLGYRSDNINLEQFDKLMTLNFYSVFEINKILIKKKLKKKRLNIIMIGSLAGFQPDKASLGYSTSKSILSSYNKILAEKNFNNSVYSKLFVPGSFLSTNGSMDRLKKNKKLIFNKLKQGFFSKKYMKSSELIPIIKFLIEKKSDVLTGSVISATNLEG